MFDLKGKALAVTGSASGIGAATVDYLRAHGAYVIGLDIRPSDNADEHIAIDLSSRKSIDEAVARLPEKIDGLANVAGLAPTVPAAQVIRVNLVGTMALTNALLPRLTYGSGIVNLSSIAAFHWQQSIDQIKEALDLSFGKIDAFVEKHRIDDQPGRSYFLTKEALLAWCIRQRRTWVDRGIRMNCVSPAAVSTPLLDAFAGVMGERTKKDSDIVERSGAPADIAPVIAFLLSGASAWIRGANIPADGGVAAHYLAQENGL
ncbi:3-alpha-hydroxysteroid dehydrogenase [Sphingopyxis fribergensis]|uniref:3-alpha-hydroxysteroid dehydrogenase n=1 Tax=Sphingopyxis fribergensis TaxID=1515612 RepID=A0A0A7PHN6_9SPHN|nr:coniferyl-alcohol dehydrogenase [Sphingopyxis fribergensis]AJA09499.1 3-alpha-hydroxysteroid dehydrogenase [Sphingopyxis fribergensis]